jgi:hypothetical protein
MRPDTTSLSQLEAKVKDWACLAQPSFEIFATGAFRSRDLSCIGRHEHADVHSGDHLPSVR